MSAQAELRRMLESSAIAEQIPRPACAADCIAHIHRLLTADEARMAELQIELLITMRERDAVMRTAEEILAALRVAPWTTT